jgi:TRAP-type C4-dicarboxylate transport system permease small subunit
MPLIRWLHRLEDALITGILLMMIVTAVAQIFMRNALDSSVVWIDPLLQHAVLWIGLLGAMIASRKDEHIRIDIASNYLPAHWHRWLVLLVDLFTCSVCLMVAWYSAGFVIEEAEYGGTAFGSVPGWLAQAIIPFGFTVIGVRYAALAVLGLLDRRPGQEEMPS